VTPGPKRRAKKSPAHWSSPRRDNSCHWPQTPPPCIRRRSDARRPCASHPSTKWSHTKSRDAAPSPRASAWVAGSAGCPARCDMGGPAQGRSSRVQQSSRTQLSGQAERKSSCKLGESGRGWWRVATLPQCRHSAGGTADRGSHDSVAWSAPIAFEELLFYCKTAKTFPADLGC
jgi:hypothetical protein